MKAVIDADACIGCGLCVDTCPEVYEMPEDKAIVKVDEIPAEAQESAKEGAENCPVDAIKIEG